MEQETGNMKHETIGFCRTSNVVYERSTFHVTRFRPSCARYILCYTCEQLSVSLRTTPYSLHAPMVHPNFKYLRAIGTLIGATIGAGVFGLPYTFAQSGPAVGAAWLLGLGAVMLILYLMFAEIVLHTPGTHRIGGYVGAQLGRRWGMFASVMMFLTLLGIMTAHIILGGEFLFTLFHPFFGGSQIAYSLLMVVIAGAITWRGTQATVRIEGIVVGILLFMFLFATLASLPHIVPANLTLVHVDGIFLPYGVVLFSLFGLGAVPEMSDVLGTQKRRLPHVITTALFIVVMLYLAFCLCVVGVTGLATTSSAFTGLSAALGGSFAVVSSLLGSITLLSIFSMSSLQMQNLLCYDVHLSRRVSWLVASCAALILFLLGVRQFITLIGFVGSVFAACVAGVVVLAYERMRRSPTCLEQRCLNVPAFVSGGILLLLGAGIVAEFIKLLW